MLGVHERRMRGEGFEPVFSACFERMPGLAWVVAY